MLFGNPHQNGRWVSGSFLILFYFSACSQTKASGNSASSDGLSGTCFAVRQESGKCVNIIPRVLSRQSCCEKNGFYVNRVLTRREYVIDHLLFNTGTTDCVPACVATSDPTCENLSCPTAHTCQLIDGQPECVCDPQCTEEDELSGFVCTESTHLFSNRCELKKARCRSPNLDLMITSCNVAVSTCNANPNTRWPSYANQPSSQLGKLYHVDDINPTSISHQPDVLTCERGEKCVLRQWDGMARCMIDTDLVPECRQSWSTARLDEAVVCGVDNRTYVNPCTLRLAGLQNGAEIRIAYRGPCRSDASCENIRCQRPTMTCRRHHQTGQPVCLDCGSHMPRDCNAITHWPRGRRPSVDEVRHEGDPRWVGRVNTAGWPVVCGSNGKLYQNTCFLHVMNCLGRDFVDVAPVERCIDVL